MNGASSEEQAEPATEGEVQLVEGVEIGTHSAQAVADGLLCVELTPPGPAMRGRLALLIESAIENALEQRGALPPGVGASSDLDASLSDQLYRARQIGKRGLALCVPSLEGIANLAGSLDAEDSAVLRWWFVAARERGVRLLLDVADRYLGVYGPPTALHRIIDDTRDATRGDCAAPQTSPEVAASAAAMELSAPPPSVSDRGTELRTNDESDADVAEPALPDWMQTPPPERQLVPVDLDVLSQPPPQAETQSSPPSLPEPSEPATATDLARALTRLLEDETAEPAVLENDDAEPTALENDDAEPAVLENDDAEPAALESDDAEPAALENDDAEPAALENDDAECAALENDDAEPAALENDDAECAALEPRQPTDVPPPAKPRLDAPEPVRTPAALHPQAEERWRGWVHELEGARGPKPLAVIERLFVSAYVPLADAAARGIGGDEALRALSSWSSSFDKSYSEAFDALRLRGKRPTMVLDVPDVALRIGRLHGARSVQLVLVDAMRFDLGLRVQDRLKLLLGRHAALTERLLLWSALPSITSVQLELIGRGAEGLREFSPSLDPEAPVARGRTSKTLRRIKAGHRDLMKLDVVEARLGEPGSPCAERLDALADEVAECLANHFLHLPPRTLVMLFGDHGFHLDPLDGGTSAARHGGASPEEVLVPGFAWLVGAVH